MEIRTKEMPFNEGLKYVNRFIRLKVLAEMSGANYLLLNLEMNGKDNKGKPFHYSADKVAEVNRAVNSIGMMLSSYTVITESFKSESGAPLSYGKNAIEQLRTLFCTLWPKGLCCDMCGFSERWVRAHLQDSSARSYGHFQPEVIEKFNGQIQQLGQDLLSLRFTPVK